MQYIQRLEAERKNIPFISLISGDIRVAEALKTYYYQDCAMELGAAFVRRQDKSKTMKQLAQISGRVYAAGFIKDEGGGFVVKYSQDLGSTQHEYSVGLSLNSLRKYIPNFAYTYDSCFTGNCKIKEDLPYYIVNEYVEGETLTVYCKKPEVDVVTYLSYYMQVMLAVVAANEKLGFGHHDLHTDNVILRPDLNRKNFYINYKVMGGSYNVYVFDKVATVVDFEAAYTTELGGMVNAKESWNIDTTKSHVIGDAFKLFCWSIHFMKNTNTKSILQSVLTEFFAVDANYIANGADKYYTLPRNDGHSVKDWINRLHRLYVEQGGLNSMKDAKPSNLNCTL